MTANQVVEIAVSLTVQSTVLIAATYGLSLLCRNDRARCRLWTCSFVVLLTLAIASVTFPHPRIAQPWSVIDTRTGATLLSAQQQLGRVLVLVWLVGVIAMLLLTIYRWWRVSRYLQTCQSIDSKCGRLSGLTSVMPDDGAQRVSILASDNLAGPFCWQFHRPLIALPNFVLGMDERKLQFVLRHELEHLRLAHPMQLFLQRLVEIVYWFHPLVWWASRQAALAREFACDDAAVKSKTETAEYLRTLLAVLEENQGDSQQTNTVLSFSGRASVLAQRARRLMHRANEDTDASALRRLPSFAIPALLLVAAMTALLWIPVNLRASPIHTWSPWPSWSAEVLHDFGIAARDYEGFENRFVGSDAAEIHSSTTERK